MIAKECGYKIYNYSYRTRTKYKDGVEYKLLKKWNGLVYCKGKASHESFAKNSKIKILGLNGLKLMELLSFGFLLEMEVGFADG